MSCVLKNIITRMENLYGIIAIGNSNWDYYYDEERNVIYYISKKLGCNNGFFCSGNNLKCHLKRLAFMQKNDS